MCDCDKTETKKSFDLEKDISESFLKNREIFLWSDINDDTAKTVVSKIMYLDSINDLQIKLFINSPGGVITSGCAILDAMDNAKSPISTIVMGQAASMASLILAHGTKGLRKAWKRSCVMIHQPLISGDMYGVNADLQIQANEMKRIREEMNLQLSLDTGKTIEQIELDTDRDNFMTANQALEYGLVDSIV